MVYHYTINNDLFIIVILKYALRVLSAIYGVINDLHENRRGLSSMHHFCGFVRRCSHQVHYLCNIRDREMLLQLHDSIKKNNGIN